MLLPRLNCKVHGMNETNTLTAGRRRMKRLEWSAAYVRAPGDRHVLKFSACISLTYTCEDRLCFDHKVRLGEGPSCRLTALIADQGPAGSSAEDEISWNDVPSDKDCTLIFLLISNIHLG